MSKADLSVIKQSLSACGCKGCLDIDQNHIVKGLDHLRQGEVGHAEAIAMPANAAFRQTQRLNGRQGQIVDQDGHLRILTKARDQPLRLLDIEGIVGIFRVGLGARETNLVPRPERADKNHLVRVVTGKPYIIGKGGGDAQVNALVTGGLTQKIGLHLQIAIAKKDGLNPS